MKKFIQIIVILLAIMALCACTEKREEAPKELTDLEYIREKGVLVVGITDFAPMDYMENNEWTGFDAEVGKKVAADLGVKIEFVEIDWDNKIFELNNKSIDCVWNGMTLTDEVKASMGRFRHESNRGAPGHGLYRQILHYRQEAIRRELVCRPCTSDSFGS